MMSKRKLLIILILFSMIINSCFYQPTVKEKVIYITPSYCVKPPKPKFKKLDPNLGLTSSKNLSILINNIIELKTYSELLENTIECYEKQIKKFKELQNDTNKQNRIRKMDK